MDNGCAADRVGLRDGHRHGARRRAAVLGIADTNVPRVRVVELAPVVLLLILCAALTVAGGGADALPRRSGTGAAHADRYIDEVLNRR